MDVRCPPNTLQIFSVCCALSSIYLFWQQIQKPFQNIINYSGSIQSPEFTDCNLTAISIKTSASIKHFQNMS
jgi:hypothetical protein